MTRRPDYILELRRASVLGTALAMSSTILVACAAVPWLEARPDLAARVLLLPHAGLVVACFVLLWRFLGDPDLTGGRARGSLPPPDERREGRC